MAELPSAQPELKDEDVEKHINDLNKVKSEEEYENKLSKIGVTMASWMKIIFNMDSKQEFKAEWLTIDEYKSQAEDSMVKAWRIITLPNWTVEKRGTRGDVVESTRTDVYGKVYRFTGVVECPAKFLFEEFRDNLTRLPEWNPTILKSEIIKEIGPGVDLSYQVTAGGGRGIIAPRDFVILRRTAPLSRDGRVDDSGSPHCYISSGVSVTVPGYPPHRDLVRGQNKVGCWLLKPRSVQLPSGKIENQTTFQWLMCCDLKGKIPQFVLDAAFATVMLDYITHVRKFVADAKAKARF